MMMIIIIITEYREALCVAGEICIKPHGSVNPTLTWPETGSRIGTGIGARTGTGIRIEIGIGTWEQVS